MAEIKDVLAERYVLEDFIGHGGMSEVYRAHDRLMDQKVAVKVIHPHLVRSSAVLERFRQEVTIARKIAHPGVIRIYELFEFPEDELVFLVMEYLGGGSLKTRIEDAGLLPEKEVVRIGREALAALGAAHAKGIVHRDIKPHNILFNAEGGVKITDFGLAQTGAIQGIAAMMQVSGTPEYCPPETVEGGYADGRADLYSLGALMYRALTGRSHIPATFASLMQPAKEVTPPHLIDPSIPEWLSGLLMRLLGPADARPSSAEAVLDILEKRRLPPEMKWKTCLYCRKSIPLEVSICIHCGRPELVIERYDGADAESLVLKKISEKVEVMKEFIWLLRVLSGRDDYTVKLITEDTRLYSREEKRKSTALPVRVLDDLSPETLTALLPLFEREWKSLVRLERCPLQKARRKYKNGPLITPKQGAVKVRLAEEFLLREVTAGAAVRGGEAEALPENGSAAAPHAKHADGSRERTYLECLTSAYRLISALSDDPAAGPLLERLSALMQRLRQGLEAAERVAGYLDSVSLGAVYGELQRLERLIEKEEDPQRTDELIRRKLLEQSVLEKYRQEEIRYGRISAAIFRVKVRLELLAAEASAGAEKNDVQLEAIEELGRFLSAAGETEAGTPQP